MVHSIFPDTEVVEVRVEPNFGVVEAKETNLLEPFLCSPGGQKANAFRKSGDCFYLSLEMVLYQSFRHLSEGLVSEQFHDSW